MQNKIVRYVSVTDSYDDEPENIKYWIYVVLSEIYEDFELVEPFKQLAANFGKIFDKTVKVSIPIKSRYQKTRNSVLMKDWESRFQETLDSTDIPFWLILRDSIRYFDPNLDEYAIIWFPDAIENPELYIKALKRIENHIRRGKDLISWVNHHNKRSKYRSALKTLYSAIELKPGAFGFCIELKALLSMEEGKNFNNADIPEGK